MRLLMLGAVVGVALAGVLLHAIRIFIPCGIITWPFC